MNPVCQDQSSDRATSSLAKPPPDTVGVSQPTGDPPELGLGALAVAIDQGGRIVAAEPICTPLFYWQPAELVGQPLEVLLWSGADKIRQHLVPDQSASDSDNTVPPRLFALARRKDDTSFAVAVTLRRQAGSWWAVSFHHVNSPPSAQSEMRAGGLSHPTSGVRRRRGRVTDSLAMESIPDIFHRAPVDTAPLLEQATTAPAVSLEPPASASEAPLGQSQLAPVAPPAQPAPANSDVRLLEQQQRLSQSTADLQVSQAHLQQKEEELKAANTAAQKATAALEAETARRTELEGQLAQARQASDELNSRLSAEQQTRAESEARLHEAEQRLAQKQAAPAPSADEPALRDQILELESRLRTTVSSLARTTAELETERGERGRSEQRAAALATQMQQLHGELKGHLASEQADHQRLAELEQKLHEQGQQNDLTVAKLQSALQIEECERKRLETELVCSRAQSADSARAGRAQVKRLRSQLQPPVESLHQDVCRLLQLELAEDQKQRVQTLLENVLLLQSALQEASEG